MRTTDFSHAPAIGQATAQFVGATCFAGPLRLLGLYRRWRPLVKRLKQTPGYRGHRVWYRFPFTLGTIAFFADRDALLKFARSPEHASIMRWVMQPGNARGGFIRFYEVLPHGYSSGIWRAEDHEMKAIEHFTPLSSETPDQVPSVTECVTRER
ncbi:MAG: hypothetical protein J2P37_30670 [Ktedonobacteraceae bacterium]|nr:hypothetical protein [Ktedonobacteraceae bacterium]